MGPRIREAVMAGRGDEYLPFAGQSVGLIGEVLPAAEIVRRVVEEAEAALERVP
jgi:enoyl-[acyl-carrier protein] reductase II